VYIYIYIIINLYTCFTQTGFIFGLLQTSSFTEVPSAHLNGGHLRADCWEATGWNRTCGDTKLLDQMRFFKKIPLFFSVKGLKKIGLQNIHEARGRFRVWLVVGTDVLNGPSLGRPVWAKHFVRFVEVRFL